jgi:hypothetical protein
VLIVGAKSSTLVVKAVYPLAVLISYQARPPHSPMPLKRAAKKAGVGAASDLAVPSWIFANPPITRLRRQSDKSAGRRVTPTATSPILLQ